MPSEIRVDKINSLSGVGTVTLSPTGVDIAGITTVATFKVGTGVTASSDGNIFATGVTTSTTFVGALTGNVTGNISGGTVAGSTGTFTGDVDIASSLVHTGDTDTKLTFTTDNISLQTGGTARLNITSGGNLEMPNDNDYIKIGAGQDLQLVHTGTASYIDNNSGDFYIRGVDEKWLYIQAKAGENSIICKDDAAVELYHDNTKQCETAANGLAFPSGKGINFSATSDGSGTNQNELLDDYEEGNFAPTFYYTSGTSGVAYSNQEARYTKIGRLVSIQIKMTVSNIGSGNNNMRIGGLPFAPVNANVSYDYMNFDTIVGMNIGSGRVPFAQMEDYGGGGRITMYSYDYSSSSNYAEINSSHLTNGLNIALNGIYVTS